MFGALANLSFYTLQQQFILMETLRSVRAEDYLILGNMKNENISQKSLNKNFSTEASVKGKGDYL